MGAASCCQAPSSLRVKVKEPCRYIEQSIFGLEPRMHKTPRLTPYRMDGVCKAVCHPAQAMTTVSPFQHSLSLEKCLWEGSKEVLVAADTASTTKR